MKRTFLIPVFLMLLFTACQSGLENIPVNYNVVWKSQSENSSESMPCGGGDIGLNVWVEKGDILFYLSRSGVFDENNTFPKLGRIRVSLDPNPFTGEDFRQELVLKEGYVKIYGNNASGSGEAVIWVNVSAPVVHFDLKTAMKTDVEVVYESWRYRDRFMRRSETFQSSYKWAPIENLVTKKDEISFEDEGVLFYHQNTGETIFDVTVRQQGMDSVKKEMFNPLEGLIFGGFLRGKDLTTSGRVADNYLDTDFMGWKLINKRPSRRHEFQIFFHTDQSVPVESWHEALKETIAGYANNYNKIFRKNCRWWNNFWERSFIIVNKENKEPSDEAWQVGRNYQLFRYMLGCNAYGSYPTKFNGGLFSFDPRFTDPGRPFTPDFRNWGGGTFTAQNQRLVYFPMLKSGDIDMMTSQLAFYSRMLGNAELRSRVYWNHEGACFTEQIENFGLPNCSEYGWNRPEDLDKGIQHNAWLEYQWDTSLEFCWMALLQAQYTGKDISEYLPLIKSCLLFFDQHYRQRALRSTGSETDPNGHLILYPGSACETYKITNNSTSTIAALQTVLTGMINLPEHYLSGDERLFWSEMLDRIPPVSYRSFDGKTTISPAKSWERINNTESPQLYPVYPWRIFGIGRPGLDTAVNTFRYDSDVLKFRGHLSWKQDNIFAACLGLTDDAKELTIRKLSDSGRRFPAFWGPGMDWVPDHNWGGSGMIGLQEMLLQTHEEQILIFPAWPEAWDVHFRLHAPGNTTVEAELKDGKVVILRVDPPSREKDVINMMNQQ